MVDWDNMTRKQKDKFLKKIEKDFIAEKRRRPHIKVDVLGWGEFEFQEGGGTGPKWVKDRKSGVSIHPIGEPGGSLRRYDAIKLYFFLKKCINFWRKEEEK